MMMPVRYSFSGNLFRMVLEGSYAPEDIIQTYQAALRDPAFPEDARFLFDVRESLELAERNVKDIKAVAQYLAKHSDEVGNRCAIVASQPVHYGLSRMAAVYAEAGGAEVNVFSNTEDAISWLGAVTAGGSASDNGIDTVS